MTLIISFSGPWQWRPGAYRAKIMSRVWWLFFAITFCPSHDDFQIITNEWEWDWGDLPDSEIDRFRAMKELSEV
jgi:hypothetical protein